MLRNGGFGFQLGIAAEIDLTFDDEEDLKEHPQFGQFAAMNFTNGLDMIMPAPELTSDLPELKTFDEETVNKLKSENPMASAAVSFYELSHEVSKIIKALDGTN